MAQATNLSVDRDVGAGEASGAELSSGASREATEELVGVLFRVLRTLKRVTAGEPVDGPAVYLLHTLSARGSCRLSDLAAEVGLDVSTVSRHVRSLEEAGHIERTGHPEDRRASLLTLTQTGNAVLDAAVERRRAALAAALRGWSPEDRERLGVLLDRLATDLAPPAGAADQPRPHAAPPRPHQPQPALTTEPS